MAPKRNDKRGELVVNEEEEDDLEESQMAAAATVAAQEGPGDEEGEEGLDADQDHLPPSVAAIEEEIAALLLEQQELADLLADPARSTSVLDEEAAKANELTAASGVGPVVEKLSRGGDSQRVGGVSGRLSVRVGPGTLSWGCAPLSR